MRVPDPNTCCGPIACHAVTRWMYHLPVSATCGAKRTIDPRLRTSGDPVEAPSALQSDLSISMSASRPIPLTPDRIRSVQNRSSSSIWIA